MEGYSLFCYRIPFLESFFLQSLKLGGYVLKTNPCSLVSSGESGPWENITQTPPSGKGQTPRLGQHLVEEGSEPPAGRCGSLGARCADMAKKLPAGIKKHIPGPMSRCLGLGAEETDSEEDTTSEMSEEHFARMMMENSGGYGVHPESGCLLCGSDHAQKSKICRILSGLRSHKGSCQYLLRLKMSCNQGGGWCLVLTDAIPKKYRHAEPNLGGIRMGGGFLFALPPQIEHKSQQYKKLLSLVRVAGHNGNQGSGYTPYNPEKSLPKNEDLPLCVADAQHTPSSSEENIPQGSLLCRVDVHHNPSSSDEDLASLRDLEALV